MRLEGRERGAGGSGGGALTKHSDEAGEGGDEEHAEGQGLEGREALDVRTGSGVPAPPGRGAPLWGTPRHPRGPPWGAPAGPRSAGRSPTRTRPEGGGTTGRQKEGGLPKHTEDEGEGAKHIEGGAGGGTKHTEEGLKDLWEMQQYRYLHTDELGEYSSALSGILVACTWPRDRQGRKQSTHARTGARCHEGRAGCKKHALA